MHEWDTHEGPIYYFILLNTSMRSSGIVFPETTIASYGEIFKNTQRTQTKQRLVAQHIVSILFS